MAWSSIHCKKTRGIGAKRFSIRWFSQKGDGSRRATESKIRCQPRGNKDGRPRKRTVDFATPPTFSPWLVVPPVPGFPAREPSAQGNRFHQEMEL